MDRSGGMWLAALLAGACGGDAGDAIRTTADFQALRFVNDSTIKMTGWTDSTMTVPRDEQRYVLRDGVIRTEDGARLVGVDEEGHHFRSDSRGWTFRQVSPDRWTARVGPSTTYTMDRIARP